MIRTAWVAINAAVATLLLGPPLILLAALNRLGGYGEWAGRTWATWILRASGVRVYVEGMEHLRMDEPQVIVSNHQSWFDVFTLASVIPKRYRFAAKKELERVPIFGPAWKAAGHIAIDRSERGAAIRALDAAGRVIRADNSAVLIFPEGTRSSNGRLLPFKKGGFMLALRTGVDIVPVAVLGSRAIQAKGEWRIRSGAIIVRFGQPIRMADWGEGRRDALVEHVRSRVQHLLEGPAPALRSR